MAPRSTRLRALELDHRFISPDRGSGGVDSWRPTRRPVKCWPSPLAGSVIENELPTYRAISPRAVFSLICGILALFSLAHPFFYVFAVLAVVLGLSADRNIQRYPDMLTGRGLAKAGAAMGLIFGLGVFTVTTVQGYHRVAERHGVRQTITRTWSRPAGSATSCWHGHPARVNARA